MRSRLRPAHSAEELARIYARPHRHERWVDHRARVAVTTAFAASLIGPVKTAADLSCGDGAILSALDARQRLFGDFAVGHEYVGPIEETIHQIPPVELFVCCETLEHLDDPDAVLREIRIKARKLVLSTPVNAYGDTNPEHYWSWSRENVEDMLRTAGWTSQEYCALDFREHGHEFYQYGMWVAW